jgi:hypothetical protein
MFKKTLGAIGFLVLSFTASAGLITDTTNGSFIDETTGLEWMDFGVNNGKSYNQVVSQLGVGGLYQGWELPEVTQVYDMWANAFIGLGSWSENISYFGDNQLYVKDGSCKRGSTINTVFRVMGLNEKIDGGYGNIEYKSGGLFEGVNGMAYVYTRIYVESITEKQARYCNVS